MLSLLRRLWRRVSCEKSYPVEAPISSCAQFGASEPMLRALTHRPLTSVFWWNWYYISVFCEQVRIWVPLLKGSLWHLSRSVYSYDTSQRPLWGSLLVMVLQPSLQRQLVGMVLEALFFFFFFMCGLPSSMHLLSSYQNSWNTCRWVYFACPEKAHLWVFAQDHVFTWRSLSTPVKINFWAKRAVHIFTMLYIAGRLGTAKSEDSSHTHTHIHIPHRHPGLSSSESDTWIMSRKERYSNVLSCSETLELGE